MPSNTNAIPLVLTNPNQAFPDPNLAMKEPNGLLAIGGTLSSKQLITAYQSGIFPWFNENSPILWWSPSPRAILYPKNFKLSRSLKQSLKKNVTITCDRQFETVITKCSELRKHNEGTWITNQMITAYVELHQQNIAHSIEVWHNNDLIGGLYGISLGNAFFGESMFHLKSNASKMALFGLCNLPLPFQFDFIDCQLPSAHLSSLGVTTCSRKNFLKQLKSSLLTPQENELWVFPPMSGNELLDAFNRSSLSGKNLNKS